MWSRFRNPAPLRSGAGFVEQPSGSRGNAVKHYRLIVKAYGFDVGRPSSLGRHTAFRMPARMCARCEQGACARAWPGPAGKALHRLGEAVR
jgi:hypothetical protein